MDRSFYLDLARREDVRLPITADLILHEQDDPQACRFSGECLGRVIAETADRFRMPLAFPLMDLRTEKEWLLTRIGVASDDIDAFHLPDELEPEMLAKLETIAEAGPTPRMAASLGALRHVRDHSEAVPVGMAIGPFSLMTKLVEDPITAAYHVGLDPDDEDAQQVMKVLEIATRTIQRWVELQAGAGARAICLCEPAFNVVYLSPRQVEQQPGLLDTLVLDFNRRLKATMDACDVDLIFHDCGELNEPILRGIDTLDPAILSLGSPCHLPTVAPWVSPRTVIMGNLPSKKFYSDNEITADQITESGSALLHDMKATGHPFILGTECDVLCVPGCELTILEKVEALVSIGPIPAPP
jgi:uroporphyrinogen-III decarboxylase